MKSNKSTIIMIAGFILILLAAVWGYNELMEYVDPNTYLSGENNEEKPKIDAPDFGVYDMDGNPVLFSEMRGDKKTVINFWATWCTYCKKEMPDFQEVYDEYGDEVNFMMVNVTGSNRETEEKAREYIAKEGLTMPFYFDLDKEIQYIYDVSGLPATYVVNSDGTLYGYVQGQIPKDVLINAIETAY